MKLQLPFSPIATYTIGARVLTLEQIEGTEPIHENWDIDGGAEEVGDPPRVWDETLERPGCAFTRYLR